MKRKLLIAFKRSIRNLFRLLGYQINVYRPERSESPQIGGPDEAHWLTLNLGRLTQLEERHVESFRSDRYYWINEYRWRLFLQTGIQIRNKTVFEPGAGIGDQTAWLLERGASRIYVSEAREINVDIIRKRFKDDSRVVLLENGNLESLLDNTNFHLNVDLVYMWGVYYHIYDPIPDFPILQKLSEFAPTIAFDYQESLKGKNYIEEYDYDFPSASFGGKSWRQTRAAMIEGVRASFGHVYFPLEQMNWRDPATPEAPRKIIIGSKNELELSGLVRVR